VGMVRRCRAKTLLAKSFPHASGDGPPSARVISFVSMFSPREWGWSDRREA